MQRDTQLIGNTEGPADSAGKSHKSHHHDYMHLDVADYANIPEASCLGYSSVLNADSVRQHKCEIAVPDSICWRYTQRKELVELTKCLVAY